MQGLRPQEAITMDRPDTGAWGAMSTGKRLDRKAGMVG